jgi:transcriptional regulator with XRE-family HTH domain
MNIGQAVKELRKRKFPEMKQYQFAKRIGITQTYLSQLENGQKQASTEVLQNVADACNIPLAILFWFSIEEKDIVTRKQAAFKMLKPSIDIMINELIP